MTTINLRELYPWYTEDAFIEVSDEVAAFLEEDKRLQINYAQYIRDNRAFYSLERMALAQLTPSQRRRLFASVLNDESNQRIAKRESVDESAVRRSIQRGLASLKKILKKF